jgi:hypothetical protein
MSEEAELERYPFDVATLGKGQRIEPDKLETLSGLRRGTSAYAFKLLTWSRWIEERTAETLRPLLCRISNDGIDIMTDAEATVYMRQQFEAGSAKRRRAHRRLLLVDVAGLDDQQRGEHLLEQQRMAMRLQADKVARRKLNLIGKKAQALEGDAT